jgi:hypothetical protein
VRITARFLSSVGGMEYSDSKEEISYAGRSKDGSLAIPANAGDS